MASREDQGQIILLAGILLVVGFIVFSIQLGVLTNLGQQVGRETQNSILEDYLLVRRSLEATFKDELRSPAGDVVCPSDVRTYFYRASSLVRQFGALEQNRGQAFLPRSLSLQTVSTAGPETDDIDIHIEMSLVDERTDVTDYLTYTITCEGEFPAGGECSVVCFDDHLPL